ncbi:MULTISPECIES: hypothetical protein [Rhizobium]|uniref:hypothetical protein n=1 Tax=Rhizobium phaseoli TaxID=396 RepID=UPI000A1C156C|nr:hypothetical protein [Rhizobium phaseoli]ARM12082.1 hypothetical protein Bra5_CH01845 [Rhizobium phaseoli Brasil 5]
MSERDKPFDPNDPFDASTEDLRLALVTVVIDHMNNHPAFTSLSSEKQFESLFTSICVTVAGVLGSQTADHLGLQRMIAIYLPQAFEIAREISEDGDAQVPTTHAGRRH